MEKATAKVNEQILKVSRDLGKVWEAIANENEEFEEEAAFLQEEKQYSEDRIKEGMEDVSKDNLEVYVRILDDINEREGFVVPSFVATPESELCRVLHRTDIASKQQQLVDQQSNELVKHLTQVKRQLEEEKLMVEIKLMNEIWQLEADLEELRSLDKSQSPRKKQLGECWGDRSMETISTVSDGDLDEWYSSDRSEESQEIQHHHPHEPTMFVFAH